MNGSSLDAGDNDPSRFFTYFIAAVQTIAPKVGVELLELMQSPQPPPDDVLLPALLSEISALIERFVFVLDDYHVIETPSIHAALMFLLDHLPSQVHLVITSREDPNLPLARLRVRDQLTELRAADLRFTAAEAGEFLPQVMNLDLSVNDVAALETRTEGWIAGLQLAALSMQGRDDIGQFVTETLRPAERLEEAERFEMPPELWREAAAKLVHEACLALPGFPSLMAYLNGARGLNEATIDAARLGFLAGDYRYWHQRHGLLFQSGVSIPWSVADAVGAARDVWRFAGVVAGVIAEYVVFN